MLLKHQLEAIWNKPGVINPCHRNLWVWRDSEYWYGSKTGPKRQVICCLKGSRGKTLGPKPKGKGFSFLPKFYGLATRIQRGN